MVTDPVADLLIQLKNAALAGKKTVELPYSRMKGEVAEVLRREGYLSMVEKIGDAPKLQLRVILAYDQKTPVLTDVRRRSKPGFRRYVGKGDIPTILGGMGLVILSTSQGILTGREAKKRGIGGEFLCEVW